ncbi:MAG: hypothetical protein Q8Q38_01475 [bacterium]|nr:hypothetical protein [bacterium]MDZ4231795.1 hypothetical protein [Candidatus Pacearchaeota archaeon]
MKKTLLILAVLALVPLTAWAQGLVPCGGANQPACGLCDVFVLVNNVIKFFLIPSPSLNGGIAIVPAIATLMLVIGGFFFITGGASPAELLQGGGSGDPAGLKRGKAIITAAVVGLIIIYGSWLFLNFGFEKLGVVEFKAGAQYWELQCR